MRENPRKPVKAPKKLKNTLLLESPVFGNPTCSKSITDLVTEFWDGWGSTVPSWESGFSFLTYFWLGWTGSGTIGETGVGVGVTGVTGL